MTSSLIDVNRPKFLTYHSFAVLPGSTMEFQKDCAKYLDYYTISTQEERAKKTSVRCKFRDWNTSTAPLRLPKIPKSMRRVSFNEQVLIKYYINDDAVHF